jgi:anti-anti-sigma factor
MPGRPVAGRPRRYQVPCTLWSSTRWLTDIVIPTTGGSHNGFEVRVNFAETQVVLGIKGEVDMMSAPDLAVLLDAVINRGHRSVVLDLGELEFMDTNGLEVIASGARRVAPIGGEFTIRSPTAIVARMIAGTELSESVRVEQRTQVHDGTGSDRLEPGLGTGILADSTDFNAFPGAQLLERIAAIPADHHRVDGGLRLVVALTQASVEGADGVSVSLQRHGRLTTVAATDQTILDMDARQYATGEGPCVDASVEGHWFHAETLDHETRWPTFTPKAQRLGINAILSNPLITEHGPVGALNIYSCTAAAFSPKERALASTFASEASILLQAEGVDVSDERLSERIAAALRNRHTIAQAEGVVMEREGISAERAYTAMRVISQRDSRPLAERAADVVDSTRRTRGALPAPKETSP